MSNTTVNCSLALGGTALIVAGATGMYCKSNITHLRGVAEVHENDISALFGEMRDIKESFKEKSVTESAIEDINNRMDMLERRLSDIQRMLEGGVHGETRSNRKHIRNHSGKRKATPEVDTDDPEYIIRMVRMESKRQGL